MISRKIYMIYNQLRNIQVKLQVRFYKLPTQSMTRKHLSRRTVLRGLGASLALPFLDAMTPAFAAVETWPNDAGEIRALSARRA